MRKYQYRGKIHDQWVRHVRSVMKAVLMINGFAWSIFSVWFSIRLLYHVGTFLENHVFVGQW